MRYSVKGNAMKGGIESAKESAGERECKKECEGSVGRSAREIQ